MWSRYSGKTRFAFPLIRCLTLSSMIQDAIIFASSSKSTRGSTFCLASVLNRVLENRWGYLRQRTCVPRYSALDAICCPRSREVLDYWIQRPPRSRMARPVNEHSDRKHDEDNSAFLLHSIAFEVIICAREIDHSLLQSHRITFQPVAGSIWVYQQQEFVQPAYHQPNLASRK